GTRTGGGCRESGPAAHPCRRLGRHPDTARPRSAAPRGDRVMSRIRWQPVLGGYLTLVVLWTVLQRGPAGRLGGLPDDTLRVMARLFDSGAAGVPNKHDQQATNPTPSQGNPPPGAPPPPHCPGGQPAIWDEHERNWLCLQQNVIAPGGIRQPTPSGGMTTAE